MVLGNGIGRVIEVKSGLLSDLQRSCGMYCYFLRSEEEVLRQG